MDKITANPQHLFSKAMSAINTLYSSIEADYMLESSKKIMLRELPTLYQILNSHSLMKSLIDNINQILSTKQKELQIKLVKEGRKVARKIWEEFGDEAKYSRDR